LLSYEREQHDSVSEEAEYWVKVPSVSGTVDTEIYIYYTTTVTADGAEPTNVWNSNFKSVWHLKDDPNNSTVQDSTFVGNDGTKRAAANPAEATGKIGAGQDFEYSNSDRISISDPVNSNSVDTEVTVEAWIKGESFTIQGDIIWLAKGTIQLFTSDSGDGRSISG
ncbi:MAG: hypothetical protein WC921_01685, partial [Candidatus Paceibacterota bacterium]